MNRVRLFLPAFLLASTFCAAADKLTICVSVGTEQNTLTSALGSFEKAAIKQVSGSKKYVGANAKNTEQCDYQLSLTVAESRPYEVGVVMRTSNDPLLKEQAERPEIKFEVTYTLKKNPSEEVIRRGSGFRREDAYPDPNARLSAIEDAVDNSLKHFKDKP